MAIRIPCPHCGERDLDEFRFGGEARNRPAPDATKDAWVAYNYMRKNAVGDQVEWWYHKLGCGAWFQIRRDTKSNVIVPVAPKARP